MTRFIQLIIIVFLGQTNFLLSQTTPTISFEGYIMSKQTNTPIKNVLVYQENSSNYTETDVNGFFSIQIDQLLGDIIQLNHIGYKDKALNTTKLKSGSTFILSEQNNVLDELVVKGKKLKLRRKWTKIFNREFLGIVSKDSPINFHNPKSVLFYEENNVIKGYSSEPLVISNSSTGYEIHFNLKEFTYNEISGEMSYKGKAYFKTQPEADISNEQRLKRKEVYDNSLRHFLTTLLKQESVEDAYILSWADKKSGNKFKLTRPIEKEDGLLVRGNGEHILQIPETLSFIKTKDFEEFKKVNDKLITSNNIFLIVNTFDTVDTEFPNSFLVSKTGRLVFNDYGILQNVKDVVEYGKITGQRVGEMLPLDYIPL